MSFREKLSAMNEAWKQNKDKPPGCLDGVYNFQLQKLELAESSTNKMMLKREHFCLDGEYEGNVERDQIVLGTEFGDRQLAVFIEQMGYTSPDDLGDLEDIAAAIMADAPCYQAKVKKQKDNDFKNITVVSLIDNPSGDKKKASPPTTVKKATAPAPAAKKSPPKKIAAPTPEPETTEGDTAVVGSRVRYTDGETILEGTVTEVKADGDLVFEDADGNPYQVPPADVEVITAEEPVAAEAVDASVHLAFCQAHELECAEDDTAEALVEKINQYAYKKSELAPEEVTFLESIGGSFEKEAPPAKAPPAKPAPKPAPPAKKPSPPSKAVKKK